MSENNAMGNVIKLVISECCQLELVEGGLYKK